MNGARAEASARLHGLHVLADDDPRWRNDALAQARAACAGGAAVVQLRAKHGADGETLRLAERIRALTREADVLFFVNDRFDLALLADADGVHLGQDDLAPSRLPTHARRRLLVGRSSHTLSQAEATRAEPCDYVAMGPVFGTTSKASPWSARGLDLVRAAAAAVGRRPLVAIGGVDAARAPDVVRAGARGVAVISAVAAAADPVAAVQALARAVREAQPPA